MFHFNLFLQEKNFTDSEGSGGTEEVHHLCPIHILKIPSKLTDLKDLALGNGVENKDINILLHTYSICMHKNFNKSCIILTNCYWSQTHRLQNVYWRPCFPRWW